MVGFIAYTLCCMGETLAVLMLFTYCYLTGVIYNIYKINKIICFP